VYTKFWPENLKVRGHLWCIAINRRIILELVLMKLGIRVRIGFVWVRIGIRGELS
jgi:hypothetical protein